MLLWYLCIAFVQPQNRFTFLWPLRIANLSFIFSVGLYLLACVKERTPPIRFGPATILACFLLFFATLSQFFGVYQISSDWNPYIDLIVKNAVLIILLEAMLTSVKRVWATQMVMLVATLWWVKSGLRLAGAGATYAGDRLMGAAVGLIENPNSFAYMLCVFLPLYLYAYQQSKTWWERYAFLGVAIATIFVILQTGSRTGLVTLGAVGIFLLPHYFRNNLKALLLILLAFSLLLPLSGEKNITRFKTIPQSISAFLGKRPETSGPLTQDEQSASERNSKNVDTWRLIKAYPIFGVGIWPNARQFVSRFPMAAIGQVHCEILMAGRQMGFIGMGMYAGFLLVMLVCGAKTRRLAADWPAVSSLGWTFQLQAIAIIVGGSFCPIPWQIPMMALSASASALPGVLKAQKQADERSPYLKTDLLLR